MAKTIVKKAAEKKRPTRSAAPKPKTNKKWFEDRLHTLGISQRELARRLDMAPELTQRTLAGNRRVRPEEIGRIAEVLQVSTDEVAKNLGIEISNRNSQVRVIGTANAKGEVLPAKGEVLRLFIDAPKDLPKGAAAIRVEDTKAPQYGWLFYYVPSETVDMNALGRLSVCKLENGSTLVRFMERGFETGKYNLVGLDSSMMEDVAITAASPILWVKI